MTSKDPLDTACAWIVAAHLGITQGSILDGKTADEIKTLIVQNCESVNGIPVYGEPSNADTDDPRDSEWMNGFAEGFSTGIALEG